jgi:AraC-like DNA-binding protein
MQLDYYQPTPAMQPNLRIRLAGHSSYQFGHAPPQPAPAIALIGPTSQAYRLDFSPGFRMLPVGLLPCGWRNLAGLPAHECADQMLAADHLWPATALAHMLEQLHDHPLNGSHRLCVESLLACALQTEAIDHWLEHNATLSLDVLSHHLGVGARQLRRITEHSHGLSPKALAMKYRALRMAQALVQANGQRQHPALAQALLPYADQAHAIRDFQRFTGWTPAAFSQAPQGIARATLIGRMRAGAQRPLVLMS